MIEDRIDAGKRFGFFGIARGPATHDEGFELPMGLPIPEGMGLLNVVCVQHREAHRASDGLTAFAGGLQGDAAGVDDAEVGFASLINLRKTSGAEHGGHLLALVAVDFAAECLDPKSLHRTVKP
jgi:hypothetical protein